VDDAELVGLGEPLGDLAADRHGFSGRQLLRPLEQALQVLPADVLHGDEKGVPLFAQIEHPADVGVTDFPGGLQLVPEAFDDPRVRGDRLLEELEGDFLADLPVEGPVDAAHPARAQLLDDLVAAGKDDPPGQGVAGDLECPGDGVPPLRSGTSGRSRTGPSAPRLLQGYPQSGGPSTRLALAGMAPLAAHGFRGSSRPEAGGGIRTEALVCRQD